MKALQITKYGDLKDSLKFAEVDKPQITDSEILIAVKAAALNPIDDKMDQGYLKDMLQLGLPVGIG